MGLFRSIMYANAPVLKNHDEFFGDYKDLNDIGAPGANDIQNFQKRKLAEFQAMAIKNSSKAQSLNNFLLQNGKFLNSTAEYDQILLSHIQDLFSNINQMIASGAMSKKTRESLSQDKQQEYNIISQLNVIGNTLDSLRQKNNMTISSLYIDQLDTLVKQLPGANLDQVLKTLYHLKGDILEEVGTEWINERMPTNIKTKAKAYSTGSIRGKGGQLIQDILVMDIEAIDLEESIIIDYTLNDQSYSVPLKEFLNTVEKYSGSKQIVIGDEAESILQRFSLMGIQAKSGINQLPWNTGSKNTWTSIGAAAGDSASDTYIYFLNRIQDLYKTWDTDHKNIKTQSPEYRAMADYALATQLSKVLHLSKLDNQFVLTPNGFMPFTDRILELVEKRGGGNYWFSFGGKIVMEKQDDIVLKQRPVVLKI